MSDLAQSVSYLPDTHRLLPQSMDAEQGILSSMLLAPREVVGVCVARGIGAAHFHHPAHQSIYAALLSMWKASTPIDFITLTSEMSNNGTLQAIGGGAFVTQLFVFLPTAANYEFYLSILEEKYTLREIIRICTSYAARSFDEQGSVSGLLASAHEEITTLATGRRKDRQTVREILCEIVTEFSTGQHDADCVSFGMGKLDAEAGPFRRGDLIVISGETKRGKSALVGNIVENVALGGGPCVVFSLEMTAKQNVQRFLASQSRVNFRIFSPDYAKEIEMQRINAAVTRLSTAPVVIVDDAHTLAEIMAIARQQSARSQLDVLVVDYLQLLDGERRKDDTREREVAGNTKTLKRLAGELKCVVIVLSQLNDNGKLRESRAIGQDANIVLSVDETDDGQGRCIRVTASRSSPTGTLIPMRWLPQFTRFEGSGSEPLPI